jgi:hypothetical protein
MKSGLGIQRGLLVGPHTNSIVRPLIKTIPPQWGVLPLETTPFLRLFLDIFSVRLAFRRVVFGMGGVMSSQIVKDTGAWVTNILQEFLSKTLVVGQEDAVVTKDGVLKFFLKEQDGVRVQEFRFGDQDTSTIIKEVFITLGGLRPYEGIKQTGGFEFTFSEGKRNQLFGVDFETDPSTGALHFKAQIIPSHGFFEWLGLNIGAPVLAAMAGYAFLKLSPWLYCLLWLLDGYKGLLLNPHIPPLQKKLRTASIETLNKSIFLFLVGGAFGTLWVHWSDSFYVVGLIAISLTLYHFQVFLHLQLLLWGRKQ